MELTIFLSVVILVLVIVFVTYIILGRLKNTEAERPAMPPDANTRQMQLQAYERLSLLAGRIALPSLISRVNQSDATAKEMQMLLIQNIKQEFDHNITQQVYVSHNTWTAIKTLKDQNLLVINNMAHTLPAHATGYDLNKVILDHLVQDKNDSLHEIVAQVISFEAKKLL